MQANEKQVGGSHYQSELQHWDWTDMTELPYLLAAASKYTTRHDKKNGLQDVEKALHYIDKQIEVMSTECSKAMEVTSIFIKANGLKEEEAEIVKQLALYQFDGIKRLYVVKDLIESIVDRYNGKVSELK